MIRLRHLLLPFLSVLIVWLTFACANEVTPSGGPKDIEPPKVERMTPENKSVNFNQKKISLQFDEYINLNDAFNQVVISPPLETFPGITTNGKTLVVTFKETLKENTTYTINFGEAVKDNNEGIAQTNLTYVFSTGPSLDSLSISGLVLNAEKSEAQEGLLVMLYKNTGDSVIYKEKPYYFARTGVNGAFSISNLKEGDYKLVALKDENMNMLYDLPAESIGFSDTLINLDSAAGVQGLRLTVFTEDQGNPKLLETNSKAKERNIFTYSKPISSFRIENMDTGGYTGSFYEYSTNKDTITHWFSTTSVNPKVVVIANDTIRDTITIKRKTFTDSGMSKLSWSTSIYAYKDVNTQSLIAPLALTFARPVKSLDSSRIALYEDTLAGTASLPYIFSYTDSAHRKANITYPWKEDTWYSIVFMDSAITDIYGKTNDSIRYHFQTNTLEDFGNLTIDLKGLDAKQQYIMSLLGPEGNAVRDTLLKGLTDSTSITYSKLDAKNYGLKIIKDRNANGKWDSGSYPEKRQPEKVYMHPSPIDLKPNWDLKVEIELKD